MQKRATGKTDLKHTLARVATNERSEKCTNELQTTQSIAKGKRRQQPSELITPSTAQGDAVLG